MIYFFPPHLTRPSPKMANQLSLRVTLVSRVRLETEKATVLETSRQRTFITTVRVSITRAGHILSAQLYISAGMSLT